MRVNDDYKDWNVAAQQKDEGSVLNFWKNLLKFRKAHDVLVRDTPASYFMLNLDFDAYHL